MFHDILIHCKQDMSWKSGTHRQTYTQIKDGRYSQTVTHPDLWAIRDPIFPRWERSVHDGPEVLDDCDNDTSNIYMLLSVWLGTSKSMDLMGRNPVTHTHQMNHSRQMMCVCVCMCVRKGVYVFFESISLQRHYTEERRKKEFSEKIFKGRHINHANQFLLINKIVVSLLMPVKKITQDLKKKSCLLSTSVA